MRDALAARVAAAQALAAAATPGPYRLEVAATPPGETPWGEVVLRHHPAGGTGTPIPGLRVMWQGRATMGQGRANASLLAAAPDLAALVADLWSAYMAACDKADGRDRSEAEVRRLTRELDEARAQNTALRAALAEALALMGEQSHSIGGHLRAACVPVQAARRWRLALGEPSTPTPTEED